ncbi:hypothetical protein CsSME_00032036 [Camellia sinensis var. sinensis]
MLEVSIVLIIKLRYRTRLNSSVSCVKFLLRQGLAFHGHNESKNSSNQGNFLELLKFLADHNEDVKVVTLSNAQQNIKLTSPDIQKDIVNVAAFETINVIIRDLGDALFSILIDEAGDISIKEQMAVVIRYVDKKGQVIERFLGTEHVVNTNALSLKQAMENLFSRLGLSISRLRGQGYDGASNMQAMAKNHNQIALLFTLVSNVVNVVGASCKHRDIIREKQAAKVAEALNTGELSSGQCLNQETNLKRAEYIVFVHHEAECDNRAFGLYLWNLIESQSVPQPTSIQYNFIPPQKNLREAIDVELE